MIDHFDIYIPFAIAFRITIENDKVHSSSGIAFIDSSIENVVCWNILLLRMAHEIMAKWMKYQIFEFPQCSKIIFLIPFSPPPMKSGFVMYA